MRAVAQRVSTATVTSHADDPDRAIAASIATGLAVFIAFHRDDPPDTPEWAADRIAKLRVFSDDRGRMNRALTDLARDHPPKGQVAAIPNFTLAADGEKGRRPSFTNAMPPEDAAAAFDRFAHALAQALANNPAAEGPPAVTRGPVALGVFASHMRIHAANDGPVTITIQR
jgi:D-tyrosyl-tRNA(Tyr) deacylase